MPIVDILQCIFNEGNKSPSKLKIVQIVSQVSLHSHIPGKKMFMIDLRIDVVNQKESKCVHKQRILNWRFSQGFKQILCMKYSLIDVYGVLGQEVCFYH